MIGRAVTNLSDLNAFTLSNTWIRGALGGQLYKRDANYALGAGIAQQNLKTVENAILAGADLDKEHMGYTALHRAALDAWEDGVRLLLKHGADHGMKANSPVKPAMHVMISSPSSRQAESYVCIAEAFIEYHADINWKDDNHSPNTALALASGRGNLVMANLLLTHQADIESKDRWGSTPLHLAVRSGNDAMVSLFLEEGANVNAEDNKRRTPLYWAREYGADSIGTLLVEHGANTNLPPIGGV
ncbi:ankyrin repeats (3 copies) domain-containing protein [Pochonia chlamydosporia 170]|uniref:Ankyrin repeats (3 copies) domain-containing protein n=1 Tax=Pochonia chlamydosporia 170 TaxID=1380566 RepID=A0A179F183_METCM|nr:ankyrin repeats (3 copies) domain-containing protein [Pochonia chlamydosporia 170]OAQ59010.1 ankyrin repeats (3 copies) domain-containing protein [Pochonia chlamydosporia 170]